jgi:hypothetical protein
MDVQTFHNPEKYVITIFPFDFLEDVAYLSPGNMMKPFPG